MKSHHMFWTTILLLLALGFGGRLEEATQERGPVPGQTSQESQQQETSR
jgi:hypothetical protein